MKWAVLLFFLVSSAFGEDSLPDDKSRALVELTCTKCHSAKLLLQQRLSRDAWDRVVTVMQERNGLWELEPPVRKKILDYLEKHFAPVLKDALDELGPRNVNPLPD